MATQELQNWSPRTDAQWTKAISRARRETLGSAAMFWIGLVVLMLESGAGLSGHTTLWTVGLACLGAAEAGAGAAWYLCSTAGGWKNPRRTIGMVAASPALLENVAREVHAADDDASVTAAIQRIPEAGVLYQADMQGLLSALQTHRERVAEHEMPRIFRAAVGRSGP